MKKHKHQSKISNLKKEIPYPVRINRYLFLKNYSSRRQADRYIEKGLITINGRPAVLGDRVKKDDVVEVDKKIKKATNEYLYLACYKPRGVVSHDPKKDETGIVSILDLPAKWKERKLSPLGRLDKASEGLILLSNDGRIVNKLLSPEHHHEKEYLVTVDKKVLGWDLRKMESGINIEGYTTKPAKATKRKPNTFQLILTEGKKHQIRRMCAALGYQVQSLKRIRIQNITLQDLKPGQFREITGKEKEDFLKNLLPPSQK